MADNPESFVARWSRRKRSPRDTDQAAEPANSAVTDAADARPADAPTSDARPADAPTADDPTAGDPEVIAKLPDIDSLDETSDFKPFMAKGVPELLRRQALRKLWRLNPVLANLDGLNDYDEDYTLAATAIAELKTVYKVGKGMFSKSESEEQMAAAEPAGEDAEGGREPAPAESAAAPAADPTDAPPDTAALAQSAACEDVEPEPTPRSREPAELAAAAEHRDAAVEGGAKPARTRRRQAVSRRWGESSR